MVKSIIKRIIVGVGIALCLMAIKGTLFMSVSALSCDVDTSKPFLVLEDDLNGYIPNNNNTSVYYYRIQANNGAVSIPFKDSDYIELLAPMSYIMTFQYEEASNTSTGNPMPQDIETLQQPLVYIEENTLNPNNNRWVQGYSDGSFYHFKFYKNDFSNKDNLSVKALRIGVPNFNLNKVNVQMWVQLNRYFILRYGYCDSQKALVQEQQNTTNAINNVNDTINSDSTDDPSSDITSMNNQIASNGSITQLLTLPISLYQSILNATNSGCTRFELGSMFGKPLTMPCIDLQNILGSSLWSIIDILISGIFILAFRKKMVDIFNNMTSLKDRGNELE